MRMDKGKGGQPTFANKDQEIQYWKDFVGKIQEELDRLQRDGEEFAAESEQLEQEYETTIEQNEKKIRELTLANNKAFIDIESLRQKVDSLNKQNINLETEIETINKQKNDQSRYIRELEQKNDDLERSRRIIEESVAGVEAALNNVIERNAILESEIDEKDSFKEKLQRLADETRDLKQELLVKEKLTITANTTENGNNHIDNSNNTPQHLQNGFLHRKSYEHLTTTTTTTPTPKSTLMVVDSNRLKENETQTTPIKKDQLPYPGTISPASRVMALNIVSDLIRKVGLSRFLCTQCGKYKCTVCPVPAVNNNSGHRTSIGPEPI